MFHSIGKFVDSLSTWTGKAVAWLSLLLIGELVYDTVARYVFNAPTEWSYDVSYMLYGTFFMIGAAYTLLQDEHVRIGVVYDKMPERGKAIVNMLGYLLFFFPSVIALFYFGGDYAYKSLIMNEHSGVSMWSPPIYPFKMILPVAAMLLLMQGMVQFIRSLSLLRKGEQS